MKEETLQKLKSWLLIPNTEKQVILCNASQEVAALKLREMGYPESLTFQVMAFSDDGKILVFHNLIRQFTIEAKEELNNQ